jgi:hypothetical protein
MQQEGSMPNSVNSLEVSAIEVAYQGEIQALFKVLIKNLIDEPNSHETDQDCLSKFMAGLSVAKRARQLAISAVAAKASARAVRRAKTKAR